MATTERGDIAEEYFRHKSSDCPLLDDNDDIISAYCAALSRERYVLLKQLQQKLENLTNSKPEDSTFLDGDGISELRSVCDSLDPKLESRVSEIFSQSLSEIESQAKGIRPVAQSPKTVLTDLLRSYASQRQLLTDESKNSVQSTRTALRKLIRSARIERRKQRGRLHRPRISPTSSIRGAGIYHRRGRGGRRGRPPRGYLGSQRFRHNRLSGSWNEESARLASDTSWPSAEQGFFCLLRGFLTQGAERRRLTTAQLCEYVREWQNQSGTKLQRFGGPWAWISRTEDWSAVTPHALQFLTAESVPPIPGGGPPTASSVRHSSRRLLCPRPFVDSRPRVHQWSWLLAPPSTSSTSVDPQASEKFMAEAKELLELFSEWIRTPRGLGGLADAVWLVSSGVTVGRVARRKLQMTKKQQDDQSEEDEEDWDEDGRLRITGGDQTGSECEEQDDDHRQRPHSAKSRHTPQTTSIIDDSVPPPLCPTSWRLRPFTEEQKRAFQAQESERFMRPWMPFVYHIQDYTSVVGPLRAAPSANAQRAAALFQRAGPLQARARDHPLLRPDRPMYVSLAEIVRDAVACLPNGEGTRADITTLVQNSGYLLANFDQRKLQQCVSSALDRLQGEAADPSVYFNASRRMWIYRHRHRTAEEFAELHENRCAINEAKKSLQRGDLRASTASSSSSVKCLSKQSQYRPFDRGYSHCSPHRIAASRQFCSGSSALPKYGGMPRLDYDGGSTTMEEDDVSDSHIPDIEELEAADMLRAAVGRSGFSDCSEASSYVSYNADSGDDYEVDRGRVSGKEWGIEPGDGLIDDDDTDDYCLHPYRSRSPVAFARHENFHQDRSQRMRMDHQPANVRFPEHRFSQRPFPSQRHY
ncbi:unnamed protein product [Calicophoron daubneyi]|uniref:NFRKB winged helix-like domain-containing protein n=1 Tax=Calicophoron daubneyi TaxID=300641 RepID=A0AAV2TSU2_CALDB